MYTVNLGSIGAPGLERVSLTSGEMGILSNDL